MQWLTEQAISVLGGALASARMFVASLAHVDCSWNSRQLVFCEERCASARDTCLCLWPVVHVSHGAMVN